MSGLEGPQAVIRPAANDDLPAIRSILAAHENDAPMSGVDIVGPYLRHFVERCIALVATLEDQVVAYGAAVDTGVCRHLADLFVSPDLLGHGIGRTLLDAVMGESARRTTFASDDPRALPLYLRAGMSPLWPNLRVEGPATSLPPADGFTIEPAEPSGLAELERAWTGADRTADHRFWASQADAEAFVVLDRREAIAFGYARARQVGPARAIDRLLVRPDAEPVGPTLAGIRHGSRGGVVVAHLAGPSPVLPPLLRAGFRIGDHDQFMASDPGLVDPARLVANPGML
jgi:GNAT superfamily N-acetyltransferase